ncbi:CotH kinase family protein [Fibrobacter sp. UWT2]|uniref:CotH kinase family protein n=1 Tax=Fibrobacter sp. UWT2 TaxID=1896224 RepID=UPI0009FAE625|nr:CotH kinase family protein [Fibrobacter sp. UWT2]
MRRIHQFTRRSGLLFLAFLSACGESVSTTTGANETTPEISTDIPLSSQSYSSSEIAPPTSSFSFNATPPPSSSFIGQTVSSSSFIEQIIAYSSFLEEISSSSEITPYSSFNEPPAQSSSSTIVEAIPLPNNGIPYLRITMADTSSMDSVIYSPCTIEIAGNELYEDLSAASAKIRLRGNSTRLWYDKKPYRIKFDAKTSVLGLDANKDWVLLANYRDQSKFMNAIAFDMARYMGNFAFVNANRFVEVEINGDYKGVYQLTEQIEQAKARVNIGTEGILLSLDQDDGPELSPNATNNFYSKIYGMPVAVKYPKNVTTEEIENIAIDFAKLEQAIANNDYDSVQNLLDVESFIDFILLQEITRNVELEAPRSMYLYKDNSGKYHMGPVWDFDGGFGYSWDEDTKEYFTSQTWILGSKNPSKSPYNCIATEKNDWNMCAGTNMRFNDYDGNAIPGFFVNLFANETFLNTYKTRWESLKASILDIVFSKLDSYISQSAQALENDAQRWPPVRRYDTEIQSLKNWLQERIENYSRILDNY